MYNKVFLIGRLTRDPEVRYTSAGVAVARFTLAINRPPRKDGQAEADFIRVVAWRRLAEICGEYLNKGKLISIEGRLQISSYEKEGRKISSAEVVADNMQMLDRKSGETSPADNNNFKSASTSAEEVPF